MNKQVIDALLAAMIESGEGVSDLLFTVGKPPLLETHGSLEDFPIDTLDSVLASTHIEDIATHIINGNGRLSDDLAALGSCDCSYASECRTRAAGGRVGPLTSPQVARVSFGDGNA